YSELRARYNTHFGRPADADLPIFVSNTYDAAMLSALAVHHAGGTSDRAASRDGLWAVTGTTPEHQAFGPVDYADALAALARGEKIHYKGASSQIIFDERGTVSNPAIIWKVENDAFTIVERYSEEDIEALLKAADMVHSCP
ncbi:MAG TPA: hypothetical protein VFB62_24360, partial [Polyangiaceae bacterium]|nr:hypothetical protein [Polyangiaceae bacterium]